MQWSFYGSMEQAYNIDRPFRNKTGVSTMILLFLLATSLCLWLWTEYVFSLSNVKASIPISLRNITVVMDQS